jgi:hypothetical protein
MIALRRFTLVIAFASLAWSASSAMAVATEPVEFRVEGSGEPCALSNCTVHMVGEETLESFHLFPLNACQNEIVAEFDHDGTGHVIDYVVGASDGSFTCTRQNCEGEESEWPITGTEETGIQQVQAMIRNCLVPPQFSSETDHCDSPLTITPNPSAAHEYDLIQHQECLWGPEQGGTLPVVPVEITRAWRTESQLGEGEEDIEILHGAR